MSIKSFYLKNNAPQLYLNVENIPVVDSNKHLGNLISTDIACRNITESVCGLNMRNNWVISDFSLCDCSTLDSLHRTYCMHMFGCELWALNCKYVRDFKVAWRKINVVYGDSHKAHNVIMHNLSYNIDLQLDTRMLKFVQSYLNHCNSVFDSLLLEKLHCTKSTFAANYTYLSYRSQVCQDDWFMDTIDLLIAKMKVQLEIETQNICPLLLSC